MFFRRKQPSAVTVPTDAGGSAPKSPPRAVRRALNLSESGAASPPLSPTGRALLQTSELYRNGDLSVSERCSAKDSILRRSATPARERELSREVRQLEEQLGEVLSEAEDFWSQMQSTSRALERERDAHHACRARAEGAELLQADASADCEDLRHDVRRLTAGIRELETRGEELGSRLIRSEEDGAAAEVRSERAEQAVGALRRCERELRTATLQLRELRAEREAAELDREELEGSCSDLAAAQQWAREAERRCAELESELVGRSRVGSAAARLEMRCAEQLQALEAVHREEREEHERARAALLRRIECLEECGNGSTLPGRDGSSQAHDASSQTAAPVSAGGSPQRRRECFRRAAIKGPLSSAPPRGGVALSEVTVKLDYSTPQPRRARPAGTSPRKAHSAALRRRKNVERKSGAPLGRAARTEDPPPLPGCIASPRKQSAKPGGAF